MKLLALGGTQFVGRHIVEAALSRGHEVTLLTRGQTNPGLFGRQVERVTGDRSAVGGLDALLGRRWDAIIDVSGYVPADVRASAALLAMESYRYVFISTISVYGDFSAPGLSEESAVQPPPADPETRTIDGETYGPLKVLCERAVLEMFGRERTTIVRPGIVAGPYDPTGRYTYWVHRLARGGEVLAPGRPQRPVQAIDARDLAAFTLHLIETNTEGVYNAVGPAPWPGAPGEPSAAGTTMRGLLEAVRAGIGDVDDGGDDAAEEAATFTWTSDRLLAMHDATTKQLPLWLPAEPDNAGFFSVDATRALSAGLTLRATDQTAADTLAWLRADPDAAEATLAATLSAERERELLRQWHRLSHPYRE